MDKTSSPDSRKVVLTCAQPTGKLHLGNYLGAVRNWVDLSKQHECYFGIVDLHAITLPYTPAELRKNTLSCVAQYLAAGLSPEDCSIFVQSHVVGHTELAWTLGCITPVGELQRMTQFKDKSKKENISFVGAGLLFYPVLMAADILLYNADFVPVGDDQKQHLELCRNIAQRFNSTYSDTFTIPEPYIPKAGARIMSLQNPTKKMSKSDENQSSTLYLLDTPDQLRKKIMSAVTDSGTQICLSDEKPGISNLLHILSATSGHPIEQWEIELSGKSYGEFKKIVADSVVEMISPIREKYLQLIDDKEYLTKVLLDGAQVAQKRAYKILSKVSRKAGFLQPTR